MKVLPFKIPKPLHDALIYQVDFEDAFYDKLHQHEEIQMSWIVEGKGTLIVGDTINNYKKDDIIVWISADKNRRLLGFKAKIKLGAVYGKMISYTDGK